MALGIPTHFSFSIVVKFWGNYWADSGCCDFRVILFTCLHISSNKDPAWYWRGGTSWTIGHPALLLVASIVGELPFLEREKVALAFSSMPKQTAYFHKVQKHEEWIRWHRQQLYKYTDVTVAPPLDGWKGMPQSWLLHPFMPVNKSVINESMPR